MQLFRPEAVRHASSSELLEAPPLATKISRWPAALGAILIAAGLIYVLLAPMPISVSVMGTLTPLRPDDGRYAEWQAVSEGVAPLNAGARMRIQVANQSPTGTSLNATVIKGCNTALQPCRLLLRLDAPLPSDQPLQTNTQVVVGERHLISIVRDLAFSFLHGLS